jgi:opacity protein-like surface antigen
MILGAVLLAASTMSAGAADLGEPRSSIKDSYIPVATPMTWYARADFGWAAHDNPVMTESYIFDLTNTSMESTWTAGGGIGRYFSPHVRGDITYDHRFEADVKGSKFSPAAGDFPGDRTFGLKSDVVLFNVYYDFAGRGHFTPYIGVGLGFVRHETTGGSVPDGGAFTNVSIAGESNWNAAGALMAGFSVKLHQRFYVDAGYRFLYLGETRTGAFTGTVAGNTVTSGSASVEDIHAHEFRVGMRVDLR